MVFCIKENTIHCMLIYKRFFWCGIAHNLIIYYNVSVNVHNRYKDNESILKKDIKSWKKKTNLLLPRLKNKYLNIIQFASF